ncbi:hypothetical protein FQA39_LY03253 [Lamprigera yunnana]|nr:hypothetical protein FQA39_LY03253 [Lamprigera yunnana]
MKRVFMNYLYKTEFIDCNDYNVTKFNLNLKNVSLIKAIICAGLYPNVGTILDGKPTTIKGMRVRWHPKSILPEKHYFPSPLFVYYLRLQSTCNFVHDTTIVHPFLLIFFGDKYFYDKTMERSIWQMVGCDLNARRGSVTSLDALEKSSICTLSTNYLILEWNGMVITTVAKSQFCCTIDASSELAAEKEAEIPANDDDTEVDETSEVGIHVNSECDELAAAKQEAESHVKSKYDELVATAEEAEIPTNDAQDDVVREEINTDEEVEHQRRYVEAHAQSGTQEASNRDRLTDAKAEVLHMPNVENVKIGERTLSPPGKKSAHNFSNISIRNFDSFQPQRVNQRREHRRLLGRGLLPDYHARSRWSKPD